uniref:Uncharacterized protein n=1 Tax=Globodera rostochiensis TaxID=31243 RepID=A0A914HK81_GLORO
MSGKGNGELGEGRHPTPAAMAEHVRDRSPLQQKKSRVFWGTLEEKLMKLRKSLLEAADAITEIADELFSYDMKRNEEDDGKEKVGKGRSGGPLDKTKERKYQKF